MSISRAVAVAFVLVVFGAASPALGANDGIPQSATKARWIVQLAPSADAASVIGKARAEFGAVIGQRFGNVLNGFAAQLTSAQRDQMAADPRVVAVVPDQPIAAAGDPYPATDSEIQPGIKRVGAPDNVDRAGGRRDVDIAVLDT